MQINGQDAYNGPNYNGLNYYNTSYNNYYNRRNIDTYQKIFTNIDTYMKGYNPNNISHNQTETTLLESENKTINDTRFQDDDSNLENNDNILNKYSEKTQEPADTGYQLENTELEKKRNNTNKENDNKLSKNAKTKSIKEKIYKGVNSTEVSIDKMRDFLVNLYLKYTQKTPPQEYNYDAESVNLQKANEVKEVINSNTNSQLCLENDNLTIEEINFLKNFIKNNSKNSHLRNFSAEKKLNLINYIINGNIVEDVNSEFEKTFNTPMFFNSTNNNLNKQDLNVSESNLNKQEHNIIIDTSTTPTDNKNLNAPLPSPFDPTKMDEENEKKATKNSDETIKELIDEKLVENNDSLTTTSAPLKYNIIMENI